MNTSRTAAVSKNPFTVHWLPKNLRSDLSTKQISCATPEQVRNLVRAIIGPTPTFGTGLAALSATGRAGTVMLTGGSLFEIMALEPGWRHEEDEPEANSCGMCDGYHGGTYCPLEDRGWDQSFEPAWAQ
jgi:hypothetical protein